MNVYSELWALLRPKKSLDGGGALFGTLAGVSPLTVRVGGCEVSEGLFRPAGMSLRAEDVGRTLALLPCEEGFLLLFLWSRGGEKMIFPDWGTAPETNESPLPLFREWAVDWESGALALRGGEPYTLEGDEAVKLWVRLALDARCARWRYSAHSGDYGNELAALLGRSGDAGIRESLLKRTITETLLVCPYITGVEGFSFEHRADGATVRFTVKTVYNSFETEAETA